MCYRTTCPMCRKQTWGGCGGHISSVMRGVSEENRCKCRDPKPKSQHSQQSQPAQSKPVAPPASTPIPIPIPSKTPVRNPPYQPPTQGPSTRINPFPGRQPNGGKR